MLRCWCVCAGRTKVQCNSQGTAAGQGVRVHHRNDDAFAKKKRPPIEAASPFAIHAPPSCVVPASRRVSATVQPVLSVPSWKTLARVPRRPRVLFRPPLENGPVVLLPIECALSSFATRCPSPILSKYRNRGKVRLSPISCCSREDGRFDGQNAEGRACVGNNGFLTKKTDGAARQD